MYDELVNSLRICGKMRSADDYCVAFHDGCCEAEPVCMYELMQEAADAIEELSAIREEQKAQIIAMAAEDKPRWIPVTERLPEDGKFVLVCNDDGHMMIAKHEKETYEWYYKYTNYDLDIWDNEEQGPVRYWIPLPEKPKEE